MKGFPWWTEAHKKLATEVKELADRLIPLASELAYKKKFPKEALQEIAKKGYFGAFIPKKYGGHFEEWGVTGACIILEQLGRAGEVYAPFTSTMVGGVHQILHFGTEEQKERWLRPLARGEYVTAITITEPFVGSDASGIRSNARLEGDHYVLNGKKRYIANAGVAESYMAYVTTSDRPEDKARYRHLTAFVVEKGTPGFTVERVADLNALDGVYVGYLNFDNVPVPAENRLGQEGDGWRIMTSGLNAERLMAGTQWLGLMSESIRYAIYHMQRRLQFGKPTMEIASNQLKVADMISKLTIARTFSFYTAHMIEQGFETPMESAVVKLFNSDSALQVATEAIQCMGGDGLANSYFPSRAMRDAKLTQIVAGTQEVNKLVIFRQGLGLFEEGLKSIPFKFNEELNVPMPAFEMIEKQKGPEGILNVMAEYYRVQPGLHMTREELAVSMDMADEELDKELLKLEEEGMVDLYRNRKGGIALARSTYEGLAKVHPPEYYRSFPNWVDLDDIF